MKRTSQLRHALWRLLWKIRARRAKGLRPGEVFPDFSLRDIHGRLHSLSALLPEKQVVLWFTNFCDDCRLKIPLLNDLQQRAGDRLEILAISLLDIDSDWPRQCAPTAAFPFLLDPDDIVRHRLGLPHPAATCPLHNLFILNRDGRILFRHHLSALSPEEFRAQTSKIAIT